MTDRLTERLRQTAESCGVAGFGVAGVKPFVREREALLRTKALGLSGGLHFTYDHPALATDITISFPWARHLVVIAWSYAAATKSPAGEGAMVGRFATADHYQGVQRAARQLADMLRAEGHRAEVLTDDNRLVDRAAAVRAGVGWRGRSTMTLVPGSGPWVLIGTVVTDAPLTTTRPMKRDCGKCTACLPACPTGALEDGRLDARRCLSAWLQSPGSLPHWIRPHLGRRVYGCDDCLTACPPGHRVLAISARTPDLLPFPELLALGDDQLQRKFHWWYVPRRDGRYLRRNLLVAAGNSGEEGAQAPIEAHLEHSSSMIRSHAAWALARGFPTSSHCLLTEALENETAPETREELGLALLMIEGPVAYQVVLAADEWARGDRSVRGLALLDEPGLIGVSGGLRFLVLSEDRVSWPGVPDQVEMVRWDPGIGADLSGPGPMIRLYDPDLALQAMRREMRLAGVM